jgi:hypothetical protein
MRKSNSARPTSVQSVVELLLKKLEDSKQGKNKIIKGLAEELAKSRAANEILLSLKQQTPQRTTIKPKASSGTSESVCFMIASDWHSEERVTLGDTSGKNEFNLKVAESRATKFFKGSLRLFEIMRKDTTINTIVLGLLGDFITNTLHEDAAESNELLPADAIHFAQGLLISGIQFLLANTPKDTEIIVVCHSGNHGRMTKKQRHATETGNSLEQYMYYNICDFFKAEKRLRFQIAEGYHSYVRLFDGKYVVRFHHGHGMKFNGGVGGITIPVRKAIAQWNKLEHVNLDVFGHFHTMTDASDFVSNGSLVGYNAYATAIKADFERPAQAFFLVNKKFLAKTMFTPIILA